MFVDITYFIVFAIGNFVGCFLYNVWLNERRHKRQRSYEEMIDMLRRGKMTKDDVCAAEGFAPIEKSS